jgi:hypothetical protein
MPNFIIMGSANDTDINIPVIDISSPSLDVAKDILEAASTYGFVFVKNHEVGIPPEDIQGMFDLVYSICLARFA